MLDKIAREFVAMVRHLLTQPDPWIKEQRLLVPRETVVALMDRHPYLTAMEKLTIWRGLRWIEAAEEEHFTKKVRVGSQTKRVIVLDLQVYRQLKMMRKMAAD